MENLYAGIDNGLDGGITVLNPDGTIERKFIMPVIKKGKGREVDIATLNSEFSSIADRAGMRDLGFTILLEEASKHSAGVMALCSTWFTYGHICAALKLGLYRWHSIRPQAWQKTFWAKPKMPKGQKFDTKAAALRSANMLWPAEDWTKSDRATKPHDGMVDAALIAEYGRRNRL